MLRSGASIGEARQAVGVDYRTIQRWVSWYRQGGLDAVLTRTPGYAAPGRPSRLTEAQITALLERSRSGQFRTVSDAVRWTEQAYGVVYTYTGMHALLGRRSISAAGSDELGQ
jgi:transposase